jgi:hypothetical protein
VPSEGWREAFAVGEPLDRYLHDLATQDIKRRVSNCFVALDDAGVIALLHLRRRKLPAHGIIRGRNETLAALYESHDKLQHSSQSGSVSQLRAARHLVSQGQNISDATERVNEFETAQCGI